MDLFEVLAALAMFGACARAPDARLPSVPNAPVSHMIPIGASVGLEVVDWGGRGAPLVFLAGLGNTAHVFDTFAPQFIDHFHVVRHHTSRVWRLDERAAA